MHYNCLIVDDEKELAAMTVEYFQMFGLSCAHVEGAGACEEFMADHTIELLLLDINLKEESGFALCKKIREQSELPILFISARQSDDDILMALNIGGDDYIRKPYSLSVLLAKVKIMLRRMGDAAKEGGPGGASFAAPRDGALKDMSRDGALKDMSRDGALKDMLRDGALKDAPRDGQSKGRMDAGEGVIRILPATMRVAVGDKEIQLKAREFQLFKCLFDHRNAIVTKEQLFNTVWGNTFFSDSTLNVHIRRLREKIEADPNNPVLIKTIWGTGYILETGQS